MARPRPPIGSFRDYLETGLLEVLSRYGGDIIVAGPRMQDLIVDLADFVEGGQGAPPPLNAQRLAEAMAVNGISDGDGLPLFDVAERVAAEYASTDPRLSPSNVGGVDG